LSVRGFVFNFFIWRLVFAPDFKILCPPVLVTGQDLKRVSLETTFKDPWWWEKKIQENMRGVRRGNTHLFRCVKLKEHTPIQV
jgi:hypothetical protein